MRAKPVVVLLAPRTATESGRRALSARKRAGWRRVLPVFVVVLASTQGFATSQGVAAPSQGEPPTGWSIQSMPTPATTLNGHLGAVSCSTTASCVAVGYSHDVAGVDVTLVEHWDGSRWTIQGSPNPEGAGNSFLTGVACASSTECLAVGDFVDATGRQLAFGEHWNGKRWEIQPMASPAGQAETFLTAVSCFSPSACTAVGYSRAQHPADVVSRQSPMSTVAERWDGSRWQVQPTPNVTGDPTGSMLGSISCRSVAACTAVGYSGELTVNSQSLAEGWDGSTWTRQETPNVPGSTNEVMSSVSCAGVADCQAVGGWSGDRKTGGALAKRWNGTTWVVLPTPSRPHDAYDAVSCISATACVSIGHGFSDAVAARWDGTSWATMPAPSTGGSVGLSCTANDACTTVGGGGGSDGAGGALRWNGNSWTAQATIGVAGAAGSLLSDVSCPTDHTCVAVGHYTNSANAVLPLIERWNGRNWKIEPAPRLASSFLTGVSCAAPDDCVVVGGFSDGAGTPASLAEHWDGAAWSVQPTPNPPGALGSTLYVVSCTGAVERQATNVGHRQTVCMAVGSYDQGGSGAMLAERWHDGAWTIEPVPVPADASSSKLNSVSCATTTSCTVIGRYATGCSLCFGDPSQAPPPGPCQDGCDLAAHWDGTTWQLQYPPAPPDAQFAALAGVSCPVATVCTAVGDWADSARGGPHPGITLAERWSANVWAVQPTPDPPGVGRPDGSEISPFNAVSCAEVNSCTAVGHYVGLDGQGMAEHSDGTKWSVQAVPSPLGAVIGDLNGVSCPTPHMCMTVGTSIRVNPATGSADPYDALSELYRSGEQ